MSDGPQEMSRQSVDSIHAEAVWLVACQAADRTKHCPRCIHPPANRRGPALCEAFEPQSVRFMDSDSTVSRAKLLLKEEDQVAGLAVHGYSFPAKYMRLAAGGR